MVKNLLILRFTNLLFTSMWNRHCIANVQIVFKENIGCEGRAGYFDEYGIVRDVMQNHLLQILALVAMDKPVNLTAEAIRDEKVHVLRSLAPIRTQDVVLGQYTAGPGRIGYHEEPGVPPESRTPTYAAAVMYVRNERWDGVPFILRCGKGRIGLLIKTRCDLAKTI